MYTFKTYNGCICFLPPACTSENDQKLLQELQEAFGKKV